MPKISIITPVYNESEGLANYAEKVNSILVAGLKMDHEIILIDDGSVDGSWEIICELSRRNPKFKGLRLSRNFGPHIAIEAGFHHATGDAALVLACDLQDPPEAALQLCQKWQGTGAGIVWGVRETRQDSWSRRMLSRIFNALLRKYAFGKRSQFTSGSFLIADRQVIEAYRRFQERQRSTFAMMAWMGFKQDRVYYQRQSRQFGKSGWTFLKMLNASFDTLLSYSDMPIKMISTVGFLVFGFSLTLALYFLYSYVVGHPVAGWTSVVSLLSFYFGALFLTLGVLGEYLRRIYIEVLRRPSFLISEVTGDQGVS